MANPDKDEKLKEPQPSFPKELEDKDIKTVTKNMSSIIEEKLLALKDLATLEILLPVHTRMQHRLESIKKMSQASSIKVRGHWKTTAPKVYISKLEGKKISNDVAEIRFSVYETDKKGNKKLYTNYAEVTLHDGSSIKRPTSAQYRIAYEVTETIKNAKSIEREVIKIDRIQE